MKKHPLYLTILLEILVSSIFNAPSALAMAQREPVSLTEKIGAVFKNHFTNNALQEALQSNAISHETAAFIDKTPERTLTLLSACDRTFDKVPGYLGLKTKLYQHIQNFAVCLGLKDEERDTPIQLPARTLDTLKGELSKELATLPERLSATGLTQENFKSMLLATSINLVSSEKSPLFEKSRSAQKRTKNKRGAFVATKKNYLEKLYTVHKAGACELARLENSKLGLTVAHAYMYKLLTQKPNNGSFDESEYKQNLAILGGLLSTDEFEAFKKSLTSGIQKASSSTTHSSSKNYDHHAINIRGDLYELESALIAQKVKGEKVLFLGPLMQLIIPEDTLKKVSNEPYLSPVSLGNNIARLEQEFDIVTSTRIIEAKHIDSSPADYQENLERQRLMIRLFDKAEKKALSIAQSDTAPSLEDFINHPITFYVKKITPNKPLMDAAHERLSKVGFEMIETTDTDYEEALAKTTSSPEDAYACSTPCENVANLVIESSSKKRDIEDSQDQEKAINAHSKARRRLSFS